MPTDQTQASTAARPVARITTPESCTGEHVQLNGPDGHLVCQGPLDFIISVCANNGWDHKVGE